MGGCIVLVGVDEGFAGKLVIGSGVGAFVGAGTGIALAMFAQQRAFLFGIHNEAREGDVKGT